MDWSADISTAPRGHIEKRKVGKHLVKVFEAEPVILASKCGKVMKSYWCPPVENDPHDKQQQGRWHGMHYGEKPVAWQPWPDHPGAWAERE
mgnify:CR=1 FL=1